MYDTTNFPGMKILFFLTVGVKVCFKILLRCSYFLRQKKILILNVMDKSGSINSSFKNANEDYKKKMINRNWVDSFFNLVFKLVNSINY